VAASSHTVSTDMSRYWKVAFSHCAKATEPSGHLGYIHQFEQRLEIFACENIYHFAQRAKLSMLSVSLQILDVCFRSGLRSVLYDGGCQAGETGALTSMIVGQIEVNLI
jgi:hypothetical protein